MHGKIILIANKENGVTFNQFIRDRSWAAASLLDISASSLSQQSIQGLVIDFDGVLAAADYIDLSPEINTWMTQMLAAGMRLAIHSNNNAYKETLRKYYMAIQHPDVLWMPTHPKKPSPITLRTVSQQWSCPLDQILMIDDRLWTGGRAAYQAQTKFIYIDRPEVNYQQNFWKEWACYGIRFVERKINYVPIRRWCTREESNLRPLASEANALSS